MENKGYIDEVQLNDNDITWINSKVEEYSELMEYDNK